MEDIKMTVLMLLLLAGVLGVAFLHPDSGRPRSLDLAQILSPLSGNNPVSTSSASSTDATAATDNTPNCATNPPPKIYDYMFVQNVDQCQLNQLSEKGWQINQMGTITSISNPQLDPGCKVQVGFGIDWAVLERENQALEAQ